MEIRELQAPGATFPACPQNPLEPAPYLGDFSLRAFRQDGDAIEGKNRS